MFSMLPKTHLWVDECVASTGPQVGTIEAIGVQVISHTIAAPFLAATGVANIALVLPQPRRR